MCGITGFYSNKKFQTPETVITIGRAMTDALSHRGPDAGDIWHNFDNIDAVDEGNNNGTVALGHRRLSILDLSPLGAQPMLSPTGRYVIVYNGEIYNFQDLRIMLGGSGAHFKGGSDTEVLLSAIEIWGLAETLQKIRGMFALALYDREENTLHFARDHLGKKPLYIGWAGDGILVFGSELKALRAHPDFKPDIDRKTLALYMRYGFMPAPHCIYTDVWHLPPAHLLSLPLSDISTGMDLSIQMRPFWRAEKTARHARENPNTAPEDTLVDTFEILLSTCVKDRMVSDVPLGAFLSGGIDSSAVVALMQKQSPHPIKTYSIGFHENGFDEAQHAEKIAAHLGTDHHALYITGADARAVVYDLPHMYDEPFADISAIPTYLVSKFARESVIVALSGDGGDEMLGGYNRHIRGEALWKRMQKVPYPIRRIMGIAIMSISKKRWDALLPKQPQAGILIHKLARALRARSAETLIESFLIKWDENIVINPHWEKQDNTAIQNLSQKNRIGISGARPYPNNDMSLTEHMMLDDAQFYLPHNILTKLDRASMANGLEARAPLLDIRIFEYVWRLPLTMKIRNGQGKYLLRKVLARHVPLEMFDRPKQGFSIPVDMWLRTELRDWAENLLAEDTLTAQGFFHVKTVRKIWKDHLSEKADNGAKLWTILMFQAWLSKHI